MGEHQLGQEGWNFLRAAQAPPKETNSSRGTVSQINLLVDLNHDPLKRSSKKFKKADLLVGFYIELFENFYEYGY